MAFLKTTSSRGRSRDLGDFWPAWRFSRPRATSRIVTSPRNPVLTRVGHPHFLGAVLRFCNRGKTALKEMRGLSSQLVQTAELRLIQVARKLRNCELRFAGFCRNCETAPKPRHLLQNCRTTDYGRRSFVKNQEPRTVVQIMGQKPRKNCGKTAGKLRSGKCAV